MWFEVRLKLKPTCTIVKVVEAENEKEAFSKGKVLYSNFIKEGKTYNKDTVEIKETEIIKEEE